MELLSAVLLILTFSNPILIVWMWFRRITEECSSEYSRWKGISLWIAQLAVTIAEVIFWISNIHAPSTYPQRDIYLYRFTSISTIAAAIAFVLAVIVGGRGRWIAFSAAIVPLSWLASIMVE